MSRNPVIPALILSVLLLPLSSRAAMVVYTDHAHPPAGVTGDTRVVWLDAPEQLQQSLFGSLASDPKDAERQAQAVIHSAGWQQKQAELVQAYRGLLQAWQMGLEKYPAV
ncbi:TIGR03757 family integrating conjugative element protein, partial [Salmonella enterica]|nr:TIGR03757 family integrating conjugative element protein [Salmonella enterica]